MDFKNEIKSYFDEVIKTINNISLEDINILMNVLVSVCKESRNIYIMGNGGSGSTASHYVCDFNKGISQNKKNKFKFICLNENIPSMLAIANDLSYSDIFVEQLKPYFKEGDVVFGISGSGNSINVINAIEYANSNGGISVSITGYDGGKLKKISKYNVNVPVDDMQITEDLHLVFDHLMMKILCSIDL